MCQADGWLARQYKMSSVLGTILDPAADKTLMTTLTITLAMQNLIPSTRIFGYVCEHLPDAPTLSSTSGCYHSWPRCLAHHLSILHPILDPPSPCKFQHFCHGIMSIVEHRSSENVFALLGFLITFSRGSAN